MTLKINVEKIKRISAMRQFLLRDLAENSGMTDQAILRAFREGRCRAATAGKIAIALGVPLEEILDEQL